MLNSDLKLPLGEQNSMVFYFICIFVDLSWSILGLKHVFLDPWYIPNGSCFQSFWVIMLFNSDLKLPLWEQKSMIFQLHLHFFGSFMINFGSQTCIFRSLIDTDWILLSFLLGHYFAQFRSETAIMRSKFNDFPKSSAFFGSLMINFVSETCTFRSLIYTDWISFSILLGHNVVQFRSETVIMRAEFNDFPTSYAFFGSFSINFRSETCNVWILDTYQLDIVVKCFGSLFCSIQIWNCHYENRI